MAEGVDRLVPEQLRPVPDVLGSRQGEIAELRCGVADVPSEPLGRRSSPVGLGTYIGALDQRVEYPGKLMEVNA